MKIVDIKNSKPGMVLAWNGEKGFWKPLFFDAKEQLKYERKEKLLKLNESRGN